MSTNYNQIDPFNATHPIFHFEIKEIGVIIT